MSWDELTAGADVMERGGRGTRPREGQAPAPGAPAAAAPARRLVNLTAGQPPGRGGREHQADALALAEARAGLHLDVPCPRCAAPFSQPCVTAAGGYSSKVHAERVRASGDRAPVELAAVAAAFDAYSATARADKDARADAGQAARAALTRFLAAGPPDEQAAAARGLCGPQQAVTKAEFGKLAKRYLPPGAAPQAAPGADESAPLAERYFIADTPLPGIFKRTPPRVVGGVPFPQPPGRLLDAAVRITAAYYTDEREPYPQDGQPPEPGPDEVNHLDAWDLRVRPIGGDPVDVTGVTDDEFESLRYLRRAGLGLYGVMYLPGRESPKLIAQIIRAKSADGAEPIPERPRFGRIGWHARTNALGQPDWFYVHAGGALGSGGPRDDIRVTTDGITAWFHLADPPADVAAGREAVAALLHLFDNVPDRVAAPVIGGIGRAAMGGVHGSLTFRALNSKGKSSISAFATQCFAPATRYNHMPTPGAQRENMSTAQAERIFHAIGDVWLPVDDISSDESPEQQRRQWSQMVRSLYNRSYRGRMNRDRTQGDVRPPRALAVFTAEGVQGAESVENRTHIIELRDGDVDRDAMAAADGAGGPERRSSAVAGFITWWAARMPAVGEVRERCELAGKFLREALPDIDPRYINGVADGLLAGGLAVIDYAEDRGYLTSASAAAWRDRIEAGMLESTRAQTDMADGRSDAQQALDLIFDGLRTAACHARRKSEDIEPDWWHDGAGWGWTPDGAEPRPGGAQVGWVSDDGRTLYLQPTAAVKYISQASGQIKEPSRLSVNTLAAHLADQHLISTTRERNRGREVTRNGVPLWVSGHKVQVWDVRVPDAGPEPATPAGLPAASNPGPGQPEPADTDDWLDTGPAPAPAEAAAAEVPAAEPEPERAQPARKARGQVARYRARPRAASSAAGTEDPGHVDQPGRVRAYAVTMGGVATARDTVRPLPSPLTLPAVLDMADTDGPAAVHQFVVGADVMAALKLPAAMPGDWGHRNKRPDKLPAAISALAAAGWRGLGKSGDLPLHPWMRLHRGGVRADVILAGWRDETEFPDHPGTAALAEQAGRLAQFARQTGDAAGPGPGSTAVAMLRRRISERARAGNRPRWVADTVAWPPGVLDACSRGPADWNRKPRPGEGGHVHEYDAIKAYLPAYRARLAIDDLEHTGATVFDPHRAGLWQVRVPAWEHRDVPPPWALYGTHKPGALIWLPTPVVALFAAAGLTAEVTDSATARGSELAGARQFAEDIRDALARLEPDPGAAGVAAYVKALYRAGYGACMSDQRTIHRPDWYATIWAEAWAARWRGIWHAYQATGRAPVAVHVDSLAYASDDPDPGTAAPPLCTDGKPTIGPGLGQYRTEHTESDPK
jgi:hypothetical protein